MVAQRPSKSLRREKIMEKVSNFIKDKIHWFTVIGALLICGFFLLITHPSESGEYRTLDGNDARIYESTEQIMEEAREAIITYSDTEVPAVIINENGEEETIEVPTIENIDGGEILHDQCKEGEECGLGAYIYAPTDTYEHFKDYTIGKCWNVDGSFGAQCWDLSSLHSMNYTNDKRTFSTCGTGAAKGMWACKEQNAGTEYSLVYDIYKTKVGDIAVWEGGTWGHTCVIAGPVKNGYVACLGQNQGGSACPGGGAATNIVNLSIKGFLGAFHPKTYVDPTPPEPTPTPTPVSNCKRWLLQWGDTLGQIMKTCEGRIEWGEAMNAYAKTWADEATGITVYDGWNTYPGIGLYAGHTIIKK